MTSKGSFEPPTRRYFKAMYRQNPPWFRQMMIEAFFFFGACAALLALDWKKFIVYILIPHQYAGG